MVEVLAAEWQRGIVMKMPRQAILMLIGGSIQVRKNMEVIIYMYKYVCTWVERPTHVGVGTSFISLGSGADHTSYHDSPPL